MSPPHFETWRPSRYGTLCTNVFRPVSVILRQRVRFKCLRFLGGTIGRSVRTSTSSSTPSIKAASASSLRLSQFLRSSLSRVFRLNNSTIRSTSSQPRTSPALMSRNFLQPSTTFFSPRLSMLLHHEMFKTSTLGQCAARIFIAAFVAPARPERLT